jgi:hypothetical protein
VRFPPPVRFYGSPWPGKVTAGEARQSPSCITLLQRPAPLGDFAGHMSDHIYFAGDPAQDSARRHLERVLREPQPRRWPILAAIFAGGTAFTLWRVRQNRRKRANGDEAANRK